MCLQQKNVSENSIKPFGEVTNITGSVTNNLRFPGQYADQETGLNYNYFRDYDPSIGRYIESDPIGLDDGVNTYVYVLNNPMSLFDGLGTAAECKCGKAKKLDMFCFVGCLADSAVPDAFAVACCAGKGKFKATPPQARAVCCAVALAITANAGTACYKKCNKCQ